jgi:hypothetical protein
MERPIDSHQWASKIEVRRLLSGKSDLKIREDNRMANDKPASRVMSLPLKLSSFLRWFGE